MKHLLHIFYEKKEKRKSSTREREGNSHWVAAEPPSDGLR